MAIAGTAPSLNERHVARTYRSVFLPSNVWAIGASGGTIVAGYINLALGETAGAPFVPPYDLDPSFAVKFRVHFMPTAATTQKFLLKLTLSNNDGTAEAYNTDPAATTDLTTPIPDSVTTAPMIAFSCVSGVGSLTLASTTRRNWSAGLFLHGAMAANAPLIYGVEVAYVPLIGGVTGFPSHIPAEAWSV